MSGSQLTNERDDGIGHPVYKEAGDECENHLQGSMEEEKSS